MWRKGFILAAIFCWGLSSFGQDRCGTPNQPFLEEQQFEQWMEQKMLEKSLQPRAHSIAAEDIYTLPVVVHIIHNGEAIGIGTNLSDAKVYEQIEILNQDFRQLNPRAGVDGVPSVFKPVEADIGVEFVLARQDPDGNATNGIVRKQGGSSQYFYPSTSMKSESYWPAEDYINIWVCDIDVLGWATWPTESTLPGLSGGTNRLYDGLVIDYKYFGINTNTDGTFDSYGQSATHEMGHFLGLKHIWGDGGCSASDYCEDTPPAIRHHGVLKIDDITYPGVGSPCTFPIEDIPATSYDDGNSCSNDIGDDLPDMFMNYMDYTNDECMNMFTEDQKFRMRTVLENSPRRLSLRNSNGLEYPIIFDLDLALNRVDNVPLITCNSFITPTLTLRNYGTNEINSYEIIAMVGSTETTISESNISIASGSSHSVVVNIDGFKEGSNEISWIVSRVNGEVDEDDSNNMLTSTLNVQFDLFNAPFREDFNENRWISVAPENSEWNTTVVRSNAAMRIEGYKNESTEESWLISPVFDLSDFEEAGLFFRMSYGIRNGFSDGLEIKVSSSCSEQFQTIWTGNLGSLFFPSWEFAWEPTIDSDWLYRFINLDSFVGNEQVRIAFVFTGEGGNNFYLDDIELTNNGDINQPRIESGNFVAYPNPAQESFQVTINVPESQQVRLQLIDMSGSVVNEVTIDDLLNQTIEIEAPNRYGLYFIRIRGKDINQTQRILISR